MHRGLLGASAIVLGLLAASPAASASAQSDGTPTGDPRPTVVSLMFDDGWRSQAAAGSVLTAHRMRGTFFVNSGMWGYPGYMSRDQVAGLAEDGHEIGGHTLTHARLARATTVDRRREVCQDRANLLRLGTPVRSFAYPYGRGDDASRATVESCGYTSARSGDGLAARSANGSLCDCVARLPFDGDRWAVPVKPTVDAGTGVATLQRWVLEAEQVGGWVPIVFGRICDGCTAGSTSRSDLVTFVEWLAHRPVSTRVRTYGEVVAAETSSGRGSSAAYLLPAPRPRTSSGPDTTGRLVSSDVAASSSVAVTVAGVGVGQAEIVGFFVAVAVLGSVSVRVASRHHRLPQV